MKKIAPFIVIATLVLATLACSVNVNVPKVTTGSERTLDVNEAAPSGSEFSRLTIQMGAGTLNLAPGAQNLVQGTIHYNVSDWQPTISRDQNSVRIEQGHIDQVKVPSSGVINDWNLKLGSSPIDLTISAGAYKGTLDLSGLALVNLSVSDGASQSEVRFDSPNPAEMQQLTYKTGASEVKLINLGNANADTVSFESGAGSYTLDFSGTLKRDVSVSVKSGVSSLIIIVPDGVPCKVIINGGLNNVTPTGTWTISSNIYEKTGTGPHIDINLEMGLGNLELISK